MKPRLTGLILLTLGRPSYQDYLDDCDAFFMVSPFVLSHCRGKHALGGAWACVF